jgi:molybdate/tungstate transport system permease protein
MTAMPKTPHNLKKGSIDRSIIGFWLIGGLLVLFIVLAILSIAIPELGNPGHFAGVVTDPSVLLTLGITMAAGLNAVAILVLFGTPLAYALARSTFPGKGLVESIIDLPLILPHTVAGLMVYLLFMSQGIIGSPLGNVGIVFEDAYPGIVVAMVFVAIPYYVNTVREGFETVPVRLENVARTLGASRFRAFWHIVLPLSTRHISYGALLAWGRAIGEFAAVIMIAYFPMVISTLIYYRFATGGLSEAMSVALVMIILCGIIFVLFRLLLKKKGDVDDRA